MCPSRILADDELGVLDVAEWWLLSTVPDPLSGDRLGSPDWPEPGGLLHQPARLVDLVQVLRSEYPRVRAASALPAKDAATPPPDPDPTKRLRKQRRR